MESIMNQEEAQYSADLDIAGYPGKWKSAKEMAANILGCSSGVDYWMKARLTFIEMGGEYKKTPLDVPGDTFYRDIDQQMREQGFWMPNYDIRRA